MPEEGPEPHEWVEKAADHHKEHEEEHGEEGEEKRQANMRAALTAAVLAVLAAIGGLLSGHAANDAILLQSKASDQWAYYQAKSTKGHLYEVSKLVVLSIAEANGQAQAATVEKATAEFEKQIKKYDAEKEKIQDEAKEIEADSAHQFAKHQKYSLGIAAFQVGIVLASVSIMVKNRWSYIGSVLAGCAGMVFLLRGYLS